MLESTRLLLGFSIQAAEGGEGHAFDLDLETVSAKWTPTGFPRVKDGLGGGLVDAAIRHRTRRRWRR